MKNQITSSLNIDVIESMELLLANLMESGLTKEEYILKSPDEGFDYHWFFNAATRRLERFDKGILVEIIEDYDDDSYLCYYKGSSIIIKKSKIGIRIEH